MKHRSLNCRRSVVLVAAVLWIAMAAGASAETVISAKKAEKNIERATQALEWHTDLGSVQSLAAENGKLVLWLQLVGDLPGGL